MDLKVSKDDEKALLPIKVSSQLVGVEVPEAKKEWDVQFRVMLFIKGGLK